MTTTDHTKVLKQIGKKPGKLAKYEKNSVPKTRKNGALSKKCRLCGSTHAVIHKYGLELCRKCFRDTAPKIGFKKYS